MSRLDYTGLARFKDNLMAMVGASNGIAGLDSNGKVPSSQLPSNSHVITLTNITDTESEVEDPIINISTADYSGLTLSEMENAVLSNEPIFIQDTGMLIPAVVSRVFNPFTNDTLEEIDFMLCYCQVAQSDSGNGIFARTYTFTAETCTINMYFFPFSSLEAESNSNVNSMLTSMGLNPDAYFNLATVGTAEPGHSIVQNAG